MVWTRARDREVPNQTSKSKGEAMIKQSFHGRKRPGRHSARGGRAGSLSKKRRLERTRNINGTRLNKEVWSRGT